MDLIKSDPGLMHESPHPHVYRCKKCRRIVAAKSNLILHKSKNYQEAVVTTTTPYESPVCKRNVKAESQTYLKNLLGESSDDQDAIIDITDKVLTTSLSDKSLSEEKEVENIEPKYCDKIYFIEPISWMKNDVLNNVEGKLLCPSCKTKIGSFNWIMASKCPCGAQISPSFYLVPSKVDFSTIVQNMVQVTL
jgi:dual specificity phosphatase 12